MPKQDVKQKKDDLTNIARNAGKEIRSFVSSRSEEVEERAEQCARSIRANPLQASLLALGAGYVLAKLLRH